MVARKAKSPAMKKVPAAPKENLEQMQAKMQQAIEQKLIAFVNDYKTVCEKHGFQMVPEMTLKAGEAPRVTMYPAPLNQG